MDKKEKDKKKPEPTPVIDSGGMTGKEGGHNQDRPTKALRNNKNVRSIR